MASPDYGVFAQAVAAGGALIAAVTAFTLTWKGRAAWEPVEQDVPKTAQKFAGLITAIAVALLWHGFQRQQTITTSSIKEIAVLCATGAIASLVVYLLVVGLYIYEREVATSPTSWRVEKVIGGLWLEKSARDWIKKENSTVQRAFKAAQYEFERIWPRPARTMAKILFQLSYISLISFGTIALAAASLLIAS